MAVYTEVLIDDIATLAEGLGLGQVKALDPIAGGIENTNYFLSCVDAQGNQTRHVLTLFERLSAAQLPYYLGLMRHLADAQLPVPLPLAWVGADRAAAQTFVHTVKGKPASVVSCLLGKSELQPGPKHCAMLGKFLAQMHLAAVDFSMQQPNLRALDWWNSTVPAVLPHLQPGQAALMRSELALQNHLRASAAFAALPTGPVHADVFRDNVMFTSDAKGAPQLSGVFDFYFAGNDTWLFDLCVAANDWAIDHATGEWRTLHVQALLDAYQSVRPLQRAERQLLVPMLRAAAFRFWLSRLWDWHLPRSASLLTPHDPSHFERVLRCRQADLVTRLLN